MALSANFRKSNTSTDHLHFKAAKLPTLLIVDDEEHIVQSLADQFRGHFKIFTATRGAEALIIVDNHDIAIIIADQRMPGMSGSKLLAEVLKKSPDTVRIMLTGYADIESVVQAVNEGRIFFYSTKPWRPAELQAVINRALENHRLLRERRSLIEQLKQQNQELEQRVQERTAELEEMARRDPLTNLANRRYLDEVLEREANRGARQDLFLSAIMLDLDHFKLVNDQLGHAMGDKVLVETAKLLTRLARPYDLVARYGGEEFVVLVPGAILSDALEIAERLRLNLSTLEIDGLPDKLTASFGVATLEPGAEYESLISSADSALYRAKNNGRNRVEH